MKKLLLLLTLPLLAITFNSCSKSNDGGDGSGGANGLIKKVENHYQNVEGRVYESVYTFQYDNHNRLKLVTEEEGGNKYSESVEYGENKIIFGDVICTLDNNGYLTKLDNGERETTYTYSSGRLDEILFDNNIITRASWENGNMISIDHIAENSNITCTYDNRENKLNLQLLEFQSDVDILGEYSMYGFKGWKNKNYILTETEGNTIHSYDYTFDTKGYPTKIIVTEKENGINQSTLTMKISYY